MRAKSSDVRIAQNVNMNTTKTSKSTYPQSTEEQRQFIFNFFLLLISRMLVTDGASYSTYETRLKLVGSSTASFQYTISGRCK